MAHDVLQTPQAEKQFLALPRHVQRRVARWYDLLGEDPRRAGTKQLEGHPGLRRVHAGKDYVIVYVIEDDKLTVLIVKVAHRRDVYRKLP